MKSVKYYFLSFFFVLIACNQVPNETSKEAQTTTEQQMEIQAQQGVITKKSNKSFEETYASLKDIITNNPNLKIIAELDHQKNAASVDLELRPTRIILFGNPRLGTPLMQTSQTTGLDLPQKILVWQDEEGMVNVSYNDPKYLQNRHGITGKDEVLAKVTGALDKITNMAAGLAN
ncbi:DUF302 domain-containing protein [Aquimarina spongiae]|uniref:Uncharacterized conserved protein, DUF302 family n=1 Tax=Aquimarina spongiae TaxID=570521 RepID=A0A1M6E232_9FLAO|nr:DUF302 domain-containing protein [Aquimarina spongiae]SHI79546.1 Uncharacterized conserved protein, DUF302 family [Aquimarina spongiae]